jgi:lipoyl(octanoyl) transferase
LHGANLGYSVIKEIGFNFAGMRVQFRNLGTIEYQSAWDLQESLLSENVALKTAARAADRNIDPHLIPTTHHLLFCEHPPVYTLGKSGDISHVLISDEERGKKGIAFFRTNRGGDITFHGPGQIVGYPIMDLEKYYTDIGRYLRNLEEVVIMVMSEYGLKGERSKGETGVWMDPGIKGRERKICAMGVRCSRWVTMHGFAFNVNTSLDYFNYIIPCGIENKAVTSLQQELSAEISIVEVEEKLKRSFEKVFTCRLENYVPMASNQLHD